MINATKIGIYFDINVLEVQKNPAEFCGIVSSLPLF
jgi:hypothetical protein